MNDTFKIIFIKIFIIKVNTINVYSSETKIIIKEWSKTRVYIIKVYITIREHITIRFFKDFIGNKALETF